MGDKAELFRKGKRTSIIAGLGTLVFALLKGFAGVISGSVVLLGDAVHSAANSLSAFFVWAGLKFSQREPTDKFPYGFYKVENVTSLLVSGLILFAGYSIATESYSKLFQLTELSYPLIAFSVAVLDALIMFLIGTYEIKEGRKINSQSLVADGKESRLHLLSSSIVIVGLFAGFMQIAYLEGLAGIAISLFIFKEGLESAKDSIFALMDVSPDPAIEDKVIEAIADVSGIEGYGDLKLRRSGPFIFGECVVKVRKHLDVDRAHELSQRLEKEIKEKTELVDSFLIRVEPYEVKQARVTVPIKDKAGLDSSVSDHFGRAPYFAFISLNKETKEIEQVKIVDNQFKDKEVRAGLSASHFIVKEKIDSLITKEIGEISFHTLRDHLVDIFKVQGATVETIANNYLAGKLERLEQPTREKD